MTKPAPSMAEVARRAGVAKSTVSLALRKDPRVSVTLRRKIEKTARTLGYRMNATVSQLMHELRSARKHRHVATLALINASPNGALRQTISHVNSWLDGAEARAYQLGYSVDHFWLHEPGLPPERLARILRARGIQGVVFYGIRDESALKEHEFIWNHLPSITIGTRINHPALHFVANDQYSTGLQAGLRLRRAGYRRIGMVIDQSVDGVLEHRFVAGYLASLQREHDRALVLYLDNLREGANAEAKQKFSEWLKNHRPDACMFINGFMMNWLKELRYRVPEDLGAVLLGVTAELKGKVAGMDHHPRWTGEAAIDVIIAQIHRHETGVPLFQRGTLIESRWSEGPTIREAESKAKPTVRRRKHAQKIPSESLRTVRRNLF